MPQRILGIDVGSWSVKAVLIETGFRGFQVQRAIEFPLDLVNLDNPASKDEKLAPEEEREIRQSLALSRLLEQESLRSDAQVTGFKGEDTAIRFVNLPFADTRKIDQIFEGELEDLVPFDLYEGVFDYQILERHLVRGSPGSSLSLAAAARRSKAQSFLTHLNEAGLDPKFLPVDVLGLYNLYTHFLADDGTRPQTPGHPPDEAKEGTDSSREEEESDEVDLETRPKGRLLVDIGHLRTLVLAATDRGIAHARVIRIGGADVTRAIARAYNLDWADAEAGKHADGILATRRHPAANDEAQKLSDVIGRGLNPLVRELRRTLTSIRRERRVDITRIDLLGGGAQLVNLPSFLADALGVSVAIGAAVEQQVEGEADSPRRSAFAGALAYALRVSGEAPVSNIDMRKGELAFSGGLQHLKERLSPIFAAIATLFVLLFVYGTLRLRAVGAREAEINREFCRVTKEVIGREICEPDIAESVMRNPPSDLGNFQLPQISGYDILLELSERAPDKLQIKFTEVSVGEERTIIEGEAPSFDAVDQLVAAYNESRCLTDIQKDRLRKKTVGSGVEFQLKMKGGCS